MEQPNIEAGGIMTDWINWFWVAGALVVLELFSGTFYLLMIAIGVAVGGVAAWAGLAPPWPALLAALTGIAATLALRRSRYAKTAPADAARDPNVNLDFGQHITVEHWDNRMARVMYRGAMWDVELAPGADSAATTYIIREMRGSRLIVS
jgi:membrane protein implicated in regulation of membrane protease activity